ncbi:hypothetical protein C8R45DRAFT_558645 [Mycena sanguinolenta]|nr:hypothetical protein C8R45DRAFT_558645 [Mycena sanguinolenta]
MRTVKMPLGRRRERCSSARRRACPSTKWTGSRRNVRRRARAAIAAGSTGCGRAAACRMRLMAQCGDESTVNAGPRAFPVYKYVRIGLHIHLFCLPSHASPAPVSVVLPLRQRRTAARPPSRFIPPSPPLPAHPRRADAQYPPAARARGASVLVVEYYVLLQERRPQAATTTHSGGKMTLAGGGGGDPARRGERGMEGGVGLGPTKRNAHTACPPARTRGWSRRGGGV